MTLTGPKSVVSIWARKSSRVISSKKSALKLAGVVDQYVEAAEALDRAATAEYAAAGSVTSRSTARRSSCSPRASVTLGGGAGRPDDRVAGGERRAGDVDAHAAPCAGDEPNLVVSHVDVLQFSAAAQAMVLASMTKR